MALAALVSCLPPAAAAPVVAAASDLQFALPEVAERFHAKTGRQVRVALGSSGNLRQQIAHGAPFALFMSADEAFVFAIAREGRALDEGVLYAIGRIALFVPQGSPVSLDADLKGLAAALTAGSVRRFAIANPEHAPYGRAAREALINTHLWEAISPRLVLGENVSQAAQFITSGNAQAGIIAYSLALAPAVTARGRHILIPERHHAPLRQRMALLKGADDTARAFYAFLQGSEAREILKRWGFLLPGE
ncbi:MAG TPA: molybdate ABC transporter substrate-binding protein [Burkholderiales bacterium]|nr:molybdate ABC transporter substrate-binding protein [Burkholderiales bacterium]